MYRNKPICFLLIVFSTISLCCINAVNPYNNDRINIAEKTSPNILESSGNSSKPPFIYGTFGPARIDPIDIWDRSSQNVLLQCLEPLISYDISSHPNYVFKPILAEYWIWESDKRISFKIRENVLFHDETVLDADAVKWNFERLMWFSNVSGMLPYNSTSKVAFPSPLYYLPNGTYLFGSFESDGLYNFTINLNGPFGPLLDLLTFSATFILSPTSTPFYEILQLNTDKVVGTGPFVYDSYTYNTEVRFHAFDYYWGGKAPYIDELIFKIVKDNTARMNVALAGQFDFVGEVHKEYIDQFRATEGIHVEDLGEDLSDLHLKIYCGPRDYDGNMIVPDDFQYQRNNATFRRALDYALNYTYIIEELRQGELFYGVPAVPRVMPGHNASVWHGYNESLTNGYGIAIKKARELMKTIWPIAASWDSNYPGTNESEWTFNNFTTFELNEHFGTSFSSDLTNVCKASWRLIGVNVQETIREWTEILDICELNPWNIDGVFLNWRPDYLNPYQMINPLFNIDSNDCYSRINDTSPGGLTEQLYEAISETNYTIQLQKWMGIQSYLYDVNLQTPATSTHIPIGTYYKQQVHHILVTGFPYNILDWVYFYPCKSERIIPDSFELSSNAETPDPDGNFTLFWKPSLGADSYSVYTSGNYIYYINGSQTALSYQNATTPFPISGLTNGSYYYMIEAYNSSCFALSNCITVTVQIPPKEIPSEPETKEQIPGYDIVIFTCTICIVSLVIIYSRCTKSSINRKYKN